MSSNSGETHISEAERRQALIREMQVLGEVFGTETALFQQAAAASYGLGITDMKTLSVLLQEGPMTAGEIGQRLGLTSGSVTTLIDRLEAQELVNRQRDERDRRKVIVTANQEKLAQGGDDYRSMGEAFARLLDSYNTEQLEFLAQFYRQTIEVTRQQIARLAAGTG